MKKFLLMLALAGTLAGCGTNVPLSDVPVEDKTGSSVAAVPGRDANAGGSAGGAAVGQSTVKQLDLPGSQQGGVGANAPRIIYFDFDSFEIKPEFQAVIETHARYIKAAPGRKVTVEGHTDERGGREYNLALGQKRAEAVRSAFKLLGVPDAQVDATSFGKEKPAATGGDDASMALNRRAEIVYR